MEPEAFRGILEGEVPGGPGWGGGTWTATSGTARDVTLSAPKSVSLMALVGGDERIVAAHDRAVGKTLAWVERNAIETRMQDKASGAMVRVGGQKMVAATFRYDTSRNLDPQLHTHAVIANMVQGEDGKWRTMVDDGLYPGKMAIGAIYRAVLAEGLIMGLARPRAGTIRFRDTEGLAPLVCAEIYESAGPFGRRLRCSSSRGARHWGATAGRPYRSSRLADNQNPLASSQPYL